MPDDREKISQWEENYKCGVKFRKEVGQEDQWATWKAYYRNEFDRGIILPVNLIFPLLRSIIPRVYFRDPRVVVTALTPGKSLHARVVETLDNMFLRRLRMKIAYKKMTQDAALYGTGIGKGGYDSEYGYDPEYAREKSPLEKKLVDEGLWDDDYEQIEYNENVIPGMPWYMRVNPKDFVVPWGCENLKYAPWTIHDIVRPVDEVKADPKYENVRDLKGTHSLRDIHKSLDATDRGKNQKADFVVLHEIHDARTKRVMVWVDGHPKFLRNEREPIQLSGLPFDAMVFNEDGDYFWGISDITFTEAHQIEMNEIRQMLRKRRQDDLLRFLVKKNAFSPDDMQKMRSGEMDTFVEVNVESLRDAIHQFQPYQTDYLFNHSQLVRQDVREMVGFSRNEAGEYDTSSRRTATEAQIVHEGSMIRVDERRDAAADLLVDSIRRINQTIFQMWTGEHVAQIVGPDGQMYWANYTGGQIRGDYDLQIDPDTSRPMNSQQRRQDAIQFLQVAIQAAAIPGLAQIPNFTEIIKLVAETFQTLDPFRVINPMAMQPPDMQAMSIDELGNKLQAGGGQGAGIQSQMSQVLAGLRGT